MLLSHVVLFALYYSSFVILIDWIAFYAVSAILQPCNGGKLCNKFCNTGLLLNRNYFCSVNADEMIDMNIIFILDEIYVVVGLNSVLL